jgi:hypothetical protein
MRKEFEKWRGWQPAGTTWEQLGLLKGREWFLRLARDDSLDTEMARAPTLDSEAIGAEATGSEGTGLEATGLDATIVDNGMAAEFKAGRETGASEAAGLKAIGSKPDNTESKEHLSARPDAWPGDD